MSSLFVSLGTGIAGGALAQWADDTYPQHHKEVGGVTVTPGAMGALAAGVLVAVAGKRIPNGLRTVAIGLATGAAVIEGVKVARDDIIPLLKGEAPASGVTPAPTPAAFMYGGGYVAGLPSPRPTPWEINQSLMAFQGAYH